MPKRGETPSTPLAASAAPAMEQGAVGANGKIAMPAKTPQQQAKRPQQLQQQDDPSKKIKHEYPTPARSGMAQAAIGEAASQKRQRAAAAPVVPQPLQSGGASGAPPPHSGNRSGISGKSREELAATEASSPQRKVQRVRRSDLPGDAIIRVLGNIRQELYAIQDVDGVHEQLSKLPEVVIVGGIAARRELLAALLGGSKQSAEAAAHLAVPGIRQPMCLELRWSDREPQNWAQALADRAQDAIGSRLKAEPLRLGVCTYGCSNLDIVQLPEPPMGEGGALPFSVKMDDIRKFHLSSPSNLLACCEPGPSLSLCRNFDPMLQRTILIGAATKELREEDALSAQSSVTLAEAAKTLEDRFHALCLERSPMWLSELERIEKRLRKAALDAHDLEQNESPDKILLRTQAAGTSFAHAFTELISAEGALGKIMGVSGSTLEEELIEFAADANKGLCGVEACLTGEDAAHAANELFASFDGVKNYAMYLQKDVSVQGADEQLHGFPAWKRLCIEIEVAMRLAHPSQQKIVDLAQAAVRCGGTGVHGHQRWSDVSKKLMMSLAFETLQTRINYIAARVVWTLRQQKKLVTSWMKQASEGGFRGAHGASPIYAVHIEMMRNNNFARQAIFGAYDTAANTFAERVLKHLQSTLMAGCISPDILLRPQTTPSMDPKEIAKQAQERKNKDARMSEAFARVKAEMLLREGDGSDTCAGLPNMFASKTFDPSKACEAIPQVDAVLRRAFRQLADSLANQGVAFVDVGMVEYSKRSLEYAMFAIDFTPAQREALSENHMERRKISREVSNRLDAVQRCIKTLRQACYNAGLPVGGMF